MDHIIVLHSGVVSNFTLFSILMTMKARVIVSDFSDILRGFIEVINGRGAYESHFLVATLASVLFDVLYIEFGNGKKHSNTRFSS